MEDIQKNIKILLGAPLAESVLHFKSSMNMIMAGEFKKANENLRLVRYMVSNQSVYYTVGSTKGWTLNIFLF